MTVTLHTLPTRQGRTRRRLGRGHGSGRGTTAGRGTKGQHARTGGHKGILRRGLRNLTEHIPKKRGFASGWPGYVAVNLGTLEQNFSDGAQVTLEALAKLGIHRGRARGLKILGTGALTKKLTVSAHAFSASAERAIKKAGGTIHRLTK